MRVNDSCIPVLSQPTDGNLLAAETASIGPGNMNSRLWLIRVGSVLSSEIEKRKHKAPMLLADLSRSG